MSVKLVILPNKPELGFVAVHEQSGLFLCGNCNDVLDQDLEMLRPLDTLCPGCRAELAALKIRSGLTQDAPDKGYAPIQDELFTLEAEPAKEILSIPALCG